MTTLGINVIADEFSRRRDLLGKGFPEAYEFLRYPEVKPECGLWLSTVKNAHLYAGDSFAAYVVLEGPTQIRLSGRPNGPIHSQARNKSEQLFPEALSLLIAECHKVVPGNWASQTGGEFKIQEGAPKMFFDALIVKILALIPPTRSANASPAPYRKLEVNDEDTAVGNPGEAGRNPIPPSSPETQGQRGTV